MPRSIGDDRARAFASTAFFSACGADKLITLERRTLTLLDAAELERVGDFDPNYLHIERGG